MGGRGRRGVEWWHIKMLSATNLVKMYTSWALLAALEKIKDVHAGCDISDRITRRPEQQKEDQIATAYMLTMIALCSMCAYQSTHSRIGTGLPGSVH